MLPFQEALLYNVYYMSTYLFFPDNILLQPERLKMNEVKGKLT